MSNSYADSETTNTRSNDNESENSYISEDVIDDNDVSIDEDQDNDSKQSKKCKKIPIKSQKLPIKDALKTVEERSLYMEVDRFFNTKCDQKRILKMVKIINNEDSISLRLLNWFAMKYSATMEAIDYVNDNGKVELFDVKISYRARLNTHSKKYFDPFRRGRKFDYTYDRKDKLKVVETTLCQLNFFRWMFMHELMDYVEDHFEELKNRMGTYNTQEKKKKETKKEKEKNKQVNLKNKKKDINIRVRRFTEDNTSKVVIII
jgi:hypothetical protein